MAKYTIFLTYNLTSQPYNGDSLGFGDSIHCNYIQKFETDYIDEKDISFFFENIDDFKFMKSGSTESVYSVNKINAIVQIVDNSLFSEGETIKPKHNAWKIIDVSDQIENYDINVSITPQDLSSTVFKIPYNTYQSAVTYDLNYLTYPLDNDDDINKLSFGEESFFFGNVITDIEAIAYTTDIPITLRLGDFNSTTNPTWDGESDLYITEVGIYDDNNNLVGIGKLNYPISKSPSIGRTIVFAIDF